MELLYQIFPSLLEGVKTTLSVFSLTLIPSLILSVLLAGLIQMMPNWVSRLFDFYIYVERGTPLLLQLVFIFFGLPFFNIVLSRDAAILIAFVLNYTAYFMEIFRGGIQAVDRGQWEAAEMLGYSKAASFFRIILPQALKNSLPSVGNEVLNLVKDTSLVYVLGATELLKAGRTAVNTYATAVPFLYVGIIYLLLTAGITALMKGAEKRVSYYR